MKEVDYYEEIAEELKNQLEANLSPDSSLIVKPLIGEISSGLRTLIANGYDAGDLLKSYSKSVHKLHLDISFVIEDTESGKFEIVIFEAKKVKNLGLTHLSQLIGYCLVSKAKFGVLINVEKAVSSEFSVILDGDKDLTSIERLIDNEKLHHQFGVMTWNPNTLKVEYTNTGTIKSLPHLTTLITQSMS